MRMRPESYRAAARRLRRAADALGRWAAASTPAERRALTLAIHGLARYARMLTERHRRAGKNVPKQRDNIH